MRILAGQPPPGDALRPGHGPWPAGHAAYPAHPMHPAHPANGVAPNPPLLRHGLPVLLTIAATFALCRLTVEAPLLGVGVGVVMITGLSLFDFRWAAKALLGILVFQGVANAASFPINPDAFNIQRGAPFAYTLVLSAIAVVRLGAVWMHWSKPAQHVVALAAAAVAVALAYFGLGLMTASPTGALTYLRGVLSGVLFVPIGILLGRNVRDLRDYLLALFVCAATFGFVELAAREWLYELLNVVQHFGAKGWGPRYDYLNTQDFLEGISKSFLNLELTRHWDLRVVRLRGPNLHPISYGYFCAVAGLIAFQQRRWVLVAASLALIVLAGSKGALILFACAAAVTTTARALAWQAKQVLSVTLAGLAGYVALWWTIGLRTGDYHVIGLMGGIRGFLRNPAGHGLGAGGNLGSGDSITAENLWVHLQVYGADYGLESSIGVMLYQIGIGTVAVLAFYGALAWYAIRCGYRNGAIVTGVGILVVVANGTFQEEALLSPLSIGLMSLLAAASLAEAEHMRGLHMRELHRQRLAAAERRR